MQAVIEGGEFAIPHCMLDRARPWRLHGGQLTIAGLHNQPRLCSIYTPQTHQRFVSLDGDFGHAQEGRHELWFLL